MLTARLARSAHTYTVNCSTNINRAVFCRLRRYGTERCAQAVALLPGSSTTAAHVKTKQNKKQAWSILSLQLFTQLCCPKLLTQCLSLCAPKISAKHILSLYQVKRKEQPTSRESNLVCASERHRDGLHVQRLECPHLYQVDIRPSRSDGIDGHLKQK